MLRPLAHSLAKPLRTVRIVTGFMTESGLDEGEAVTTSSFHLLEQRGEKQRAFGSIYTHHLTSSSAG